jgi:hypothetical protein
MLIARDGGGRSVAQIETSGAAYRATVWRNRFCAHVTQLYMRGALRAVEERKK